MGNTFSFYPISLIFRIPPIISLNFFETEKSSSTWVHNAKFCARIWFDWIFILFSGIEFSFEFEMTAKTTTILPTKYIMCHIHFLKAGYNYNLRYLKLYTVLHWQKYM